MAQLEQELKDAGISVPRALGYLGSTDTVHTYTAAGEPTALPDGAASVIAAHDPQPITDPRTDVIDAMDISDGDKAKLKTLITGHARGGH